MRNNKVEHDFLGIQTQTTPSSSSLPTQPRPRPRPRLDRRQSFRGISKMNPEIVRSVLAASASASNTNTPHLPLYQPLPLLFREPKTENDKDDEETAPMTIFYKGTVSLLHLPTYKAESIIKFVAENSSSIEDDNPTDHPSFNLTPNILHTLNDGDLPIKPKKSLRRFFEKRKERLISVSPYVSG